MRIRNPVKETLERLDSKTLDAQFCTEIVHGLNCSPFEAQAVLEVVKEIYFSPTDQTAPKPPPGTITLVAVAADEPAGRPVVDCEKRTVALRLHRGAVDDQLLVRQGATAFRRARIPDLCQETLSQGALLTRDDLAHRIFSVSPRTISRDLTALRKQDSQRLIPLRSTLHDIGPVLSHRTAIVRLALEGKTTSQICQIMHHSPAAVANYLSTFVRCVQLHQRGLEAGQIAFLVRRGRSLVEQYLDLTTQCQRDKNLQYHLEELLRIGGGEKSRAGGSDAHG